QSADQFWIELRAYCYALANDSDSLELTRSILEAQDFKDTAYDVALDALTGGAASPPDMIATPNALVLRMFVKLKWPVPDAAVTALGVPAEMALFRNDATDAQVKLVLAQRLFASGALAGQDLKNALDLFAFKPEEIAVAAAE